MQQKITAILASKKFFYGTVALLVVQAAWIALTARYPQAFDEQFHFGVIQLYAHQWSPFFGNQPPGSDRLGSLVTDTSFLYHYLMSFPYRLLESITNNLTIQVTVLRFLNIGFFAGGLFIFRRLLLKAPASSALAHTMILFFVLIPVVPLLASQINYDNLFIPLVGLSLLWTIEAIEFWQSRHSFPLDKVFHLILLCLLTATIKYAFLPVFLAISLVILALAWQTRRTFLRSCMRQFKALSKLRLLLYVALLASALFLWGVYGRNAIHYHNLLPSCDRVLSAKSCMAYAPWARDYQLAHDGMPKPPLWNVIPYTWDWIYQSVTELVFTISSNFESDGLTVDYHVSGPLPVLEFLAWATLTVGLVLGIWFRKRLWRYAIFRLTTLVTVLYVGALWSQNYHDYLYTGYVVAVHGRYLLPLLPVMLIAIGLCCSWLLHSPKLRKVAPYIPGRAWLVVLVFALLLQGGGFITYIVRSDPTWFWDQDDKVLHINNAAQKVLKPVIIGY